MAKVLETGAISLDAADLGAFASWIGVDEIFITNKDGKTIGSNNSAAYGWVFPEDPKAQAFEFRSLINRQDGVVTQPIRMSDLDQAMFKYVGVSRIDQPGIVQVGYKAETITHYQAEIGSIFGIIAREIRILSAEVSDTSNSLNKISRELLKIKNLQTGEAIPTANSVLSEQPG